MGKRKLTPNERRHRSGPAWEAMRRHVLKRDGYRCQLAYPHVCRTVADTVDHIVPLSVDPDQPLDAANLRAACGPCNISRHDGRHEQPTPSRRWLRSSP